MSLCLVCRVLIYNSKNKKFSNKQNQDGTFTMNFPKYFGEASEQLSVLLAMAESSQQLYLELLLLTELLFANRLVGRLLTLLTADMGICFREGGEVQEQKFSWYA